MVTIITGAIGEADLYSVAQFKRDVGLGVALLDSKIDPLVLLSQTGMDARNVADVKKATLAKKESLDPKVEWLEDELVPSQDAINYAAGYSEAATSVVVDNGTYFYIYCYFYVKRTGEIVYCGAAPSTNTLGTLTRGALGTTAAAINDNDELIILDIANLEGAAFGTARSTLKTLAYNYCEITRTPIKMTNTTVNTAMLGEARDWDFQKKKAGITHAEKQELKFLFGGRSIVRTGAETQRTMAGLAQTITTNVYDSGGTLTQDNFNNNVCEPAFKRGRGSPYRVLMASPRLNSVICGWGKEYVRLSVGEHKLGFTVNEYVSPHGSVFVIPHHQLAGTVGISGFMIDAKKIKYRYLQNRDTHLIPDPVKDGADAKTGEFLTEGCVQVENEAVHAIVKNVSA